MLLGIGEVNTKDGFLEVLVVKDMYWNDPSLI